MATPGQAVYWLGGDYQIPYGATGPQGPPAQASLVSLTSGQVTNAVPKVTFNVTANADQPTMIYPAITNTAGTVWTNDDNYLVFRAVDTATSTVIADTTFQLVGVNVAFTEYLNLPFKTSATGNFTLEAEGFSKTGGTKPTMNFTFYQQT